MLSLCEPCSKPPGHGGSRCAAHSKPKSRCVDCSHLEGHGADLCAHSKRKSICVDCMSLETASSKIKACQLCSSNFTKNGICRACMKSSFDPDKPELRIEAFVKLFLSKVIPGAETNRNIRLGTTAACQELISGTSDSKMDEHVSQGTKEVANTTKGEQKEKKKKVCPALAYPDLVLWIPKDNGQYLLIVVEIDENSHAGYDVSCEKKR